MKVECRTTDERRNGPVRSALGLSYCAYFVIPRLALEGMPVWWQKVFIWLCEMLPDTPEYICQRRDSKGRFMVDPWANYNRTKVEELIQKECAFKSAQGWDIIVLEESASAPNINR